MTPGDPRQGAEVIKLAHRAGSKPMPWQCGAIRGVSMKTPAGTWVHSTCILIVPRQNGKSEILIEIILYRIFVLDETVLYTAHEWKSAKPVAERLIHVIESRPWLLRRVKKKTNSQGEATVILRAPYDPKRPNLNSKGEPKVGQVIFRTRSPRAGRGLDEVDTLIYDEAFDTSDEDVASLAPTQNAARDPQVIYASSAVDKESPTHNNGVQLSSQRQLALSGTEPSMFLAEWCAPSGVSRDDPETWRLANPAYGVLLNDRKIKNLMVNMNSPRGQKNFDVEALGWGDWYTFGQLVEDEITVIDLDHWATLANPAATRAGASCLAVDASNDHQDRTWSVAVAVRTEEGVHGQLGYHGPATVKQMVDFLVAATKSNQPVAVVIDPRSAAEVLIKPLTDAGVEPELMTSSKVSASTKGWLQKIDDGIFTHDGDDRMTDGIEVARLREIGDGGVAWARRKSGGVISQIVAMSNATWGLDAFDVTEEPPADIAADDINTIPEAMDLGLSTLRW